MEQDARQVASIFDPIVSALDTSVQGIVQGTQTVTAAFRQMGESILLEFMKGGLESMLTGANKNSAWSNLFGVSGKGGGLAGLGAGALGIGGGNTQGAGILSTIANMLGLGGGGAAGGVAGAAGGAAGRRRGRRNIFRA